MNTVKGFCVIQSLLSNTPGVISKLGEISTWSLTYTKKNSEYSLPSIDGYRLISVRSYDSDKVEHPLGSNISANILNVVKTLHLYMTEHTKPYNPSSIVTYLNTEFTSNSNNFQIGFIVDQAQYSLPQWVSWFYTESGVTTYIRIWLSDEAFSYQFDEYETTVVLPVENPDVFFNNLQAINVELDKNTPNIIAGLIQIAKARNPETYLVTLRFDYVQPLTSVKVPVYWNVLIYGVAGNSIDCIKNAIINRILSTSTHTREQWVEIFPDLFKSTEFVLLPRWSLLAIEDLVVGTGIYSSIMNPNESIIYAKNNISFYLESYIRANIEVIPFDYKALQSIILGGPENMEGKQTFKELFSDYIPVPTTSLDFQRMSAYTKNWLLLVEEALMISETLNDHLILPDKFKIITRDTKKYLSFLYDEVLYLMAPKT